MNRISILLVALLALVVSACSSGGASPSASASDVISSPSPEVTETPSAEPSDDPGSSDVAMPSGFDINGDPELAARFPTTVGGETVQVISFRGDTLMAGGDIDPSFQDFLDSTGAELEDVSVAFGGTLDGSLSMAAFRVLGVSEDTLEQEFLSASQEAGDIEDAERTSVGGKDVWKATDATGEASGSVYLYVKDDTVYFLTGTDAQAAEILAALP